MNTCLEKAALAGIQINVQEGKEKEIEDIILKDSNGDVLYATALYMSHEKMWDKFEFSSVMPTLNGWTPIYDFILVTACVFLDDICTVNENEKLPFRKLVLKFPF